MSTRFNPNNSIPPAVLQEFLQSLNVQPQQPSAAAPPARHMFSGGDKTVFDALNRQPANTPIPPPTGPEPIDPRVIQQALSLAEPAPMQMPQTRPQPQQQQTPFVPFQPQVPVGPDMSGPPMPPSGESLMPDLGKRPSVGKHLLNIFSLGGAGESRFHYDAEQRRNQEAQRQAAMRVEEMRMMHGFFADTLVRQGMDPIDAQREAANMVTAQEVAKAKEANVAAEMARGEESDARAIGAATAAGNRAKAQADAQIAQRAAEDRELLEGANMQRVAQQRREISTAERDAQIAQNDLMFMEQNPNMVMNAAGSVFQPSQNFRTVFNPQTGEFEYLGGSQDQAERFHTILPGQYGGPSMVIPNAPENIRFMNMGGGQPGRLVPGQSMIPPIDQMTPEQQALLLRLGGQVR